MNIIDYKDVRFVISPLSQVSLIVLFPIFTASYICRQPNADGSL